MSDAGIAPRIDAALLEIEENRLNAFISPDPLARDRARTIDAGEGGGPLRGVPVAIKDLIAHAGRETTCGSSFYRETPAESAPVVNRLESAGAIVVGRTGLHEFAYGFSSENHWFGPVLNPWDAGNSPGGSSGGSAAAVAAGIVPIAIGTDTGGSVRVPAAMCGCVGLKVTHGRVPLTGVFPLAPSLDTVGPITRTVTEAAAAYAVIAGDDPADPWSLPEAVSIPTGPAVIDGLRVGLPHPWLDRPLPLSIRDALDDLAAALESRGATIVTMAAPHLDPSALPRATYSEVATVHRGWFEEDSLRYGPSVRERLAVDMSHDTDAVNRATAWRAGLVNAWRRVFEDVDVVLTPTVAARTKAIGIEAVETGDGPEPYRRALSWFTTLVNQAGLPALAAPLIGTEQPGFPPVSMQLVAPWLAEADLLETGLALEAAGMIGFVPPL